MMTRKCSGSMMNAWMPMMWWAKMMTDRCWSGAASRPRGRESMECGDRASRHRPEDIVDKAVSAGFLSTLVEAVKKAGLVEVLKSKGPFTVFAPGDDAFSKLPEGVLDSVLQDEEKLKRILQYHVVPGRYDARSLQSIASLKTVGGARLDVEAGEGGVLVGSARVLQADLRVSNGVIHVIDSVLIPTEG